ncbi:MAG: hypothetical protein AAB250_07635 [Bdellovibrionota bacterium]
MPELAAIYVLGVVVGYALTALNIGFRKRHRKSLAFRNVETNLRKADLYWSYDEDKIVEWSETRAKDDDAKGNRSFAIAGALISALSWVGVVFILILVASEHLLARSRRERALFASPLGLRENLSRGEVEGLVGELNRAT